MSLWLIHVDVWQKSTQHCKAIIIQLKINKFLRYVYSFRDFPGSPMVKTLLSNVGGRGRYDSQQGSEGPTCLVAKNQNTKQKQYCNKFNEDVKNGPHQKNLLKNYSFIHIFYFVVLKIYSSEQEARIDFIEQFFHWFIASNYTDISPLGVHLSFANGSGTYEEQV